MLLYEPFTSWLGLGSAEKLEATSSCNIKWESDQFLPGENLAFPGEINADRIDWWGLTGCHASPLTSSLTKGQHRRCRKGVRGFLREHKHNYSQKPIFSMVCSRVIQKPQTSINEPLTRLLALLSLPHSPLITWCLEAFRTLKST